MAYKFDRNKYKKMLDEMYGAGSYDSGLSKAREIGTLKAQAGFAESEFKSALSERNSSSLTGDYATDKEKSIDNLIESDLKKFVKDSLKTGGGYPSQEDIDKFLSDRKTAYNNPRDYALNNPTLAEDIGIGELKKEMDKNKAKKNEKGAVDKTIDFFKNIGKDTDDNGRAQGLDFLDKTLGRASNSATEWLFGKKFTEEQNERYMEQGNDQVRAKTYASSKPAETALEKGSDIAGAILGSLGPYAMGYGAADVAMKGVSALRNINNPIVRDLVRGGIAGGGVGTGLAVTRDVSGEDMNAGDYAKTIGLEAALGGTFDAGLGIAGRAIMKRLGKGQSPDTIARELNVPRSQVDETSKLFDTYRDRQTVTGTMPGQEIFDPNALQLTGPTQAPTGTLGLNSPLMNRSVRGLGQEVNIEGTPQLGAPTSTPVQADELDNILGQLQDTFSRRQVEEDAFVQSRLQPFTEMLQKSSNAESTWKGSVAQSKEAAARIKSTYGKIIVPEGNWNDWGSEVPNAFRAARGETKGVDLYTFADQEGFSSVDEAVNFLKTIDETSKTKLKDLQPADRMNISAYQLQELENAARQEFQGSETATGLDSYFEELLNLQKQAEANTGDPLQFSRSKMFRVDEEPVSYVGRMDPKDQSAVRSEGSYSTRQVDSPTGDTLKITPEQPLSFKRQMNVPVDEAQFTDAPNPVSSQAETAAPTSGPELLRANLQSFNTRESNPMVNTGQARESVTAIDSQTSTIKKKIDKFIEGYINKNHSAKVAETQIIKSNFEKAKEIGDTERMAKLTEQLKIVKKNGSKFEKAIQNEQAAATMSKTFLDRHFSELEKALPTKTDKEMADAFEYQMAKNLLWIKDNKNPDYKLPEGWDWERLADIEAGGRTKYGNFTDSFRTLAQDWRDMMLDYGLVNKQSYDALGENPYYIPMFKDTDYRLDNIDLGNAARQTNKRGADAAILFDLSDGDTASFFKNPLESVISNTFTLHRNALRNDTAQQALRLAKEDTAGTFAKTISEAEYKKNGGLEVNINGEKQYVRLQEDLMKVLDDADAGLDMNKVAKFSTLVGRLKTSSLEYQATALFRDLPQAYLNSQINNPLRFINELGKSVKSGSKDAKALGGMFEKAYADAVGVLDPKKLAQEYSKQAGATHVDTPRSENVSKLASSLVKIAKLPFRPAQKIGQVADEAVRDVEVKETARRFYQQNGEDIEKLENELAQVNARLAEASKATTDFDPSLQGIDTVKTRKGKIEEKLSEYRQDLRREQTYRGRDVINYSRMGRDKVAQGIRKYIMFANTTTQSKDKLFRTFAERPLETTIKTAALLAPVVGFQQMMFGNMSAEDKEIFEGIPDYTKQANYVFVIGGNVFTVPKIQELALISNPIEEILTGRGLNESAQYALRELVPYQLGNVAQSLVPNEGEEASLKNAQVPSVVGLPFLDTIANQKLGYNQKKVSWGAEREDGEASDYTLDVVKDFLGNTPTADRTEYLVRQLGGDLGKYGLSIADYVNNPTDEKLATMLQTLNPLQDRYSTTNGSMLFREPILEEKAK